MVNEEDYFHIKRIFIGVTGDKAIESLSDELQSSGSGNNIVEIANKSHQHIKLICYDPIQQLPIFGN